VNQLNIRRFSGEIVYPKYGTPVIYFLRLLLWSFVPLLTACGGDLDAGPSPQTTITSSFVPEVANTPDNGVSLKQKSVQGDMIILNLIVTSLAALSSGAAFDVEFDSNLVSFTGFAAGTFYESTSPAIYEVGLQAGTNNRLVGGITQQAGPGVTGSGILIELQFKAIGIGTSALKFTNNNLIDPSGNLIPGLTWSGGILTGS